MACCSDSETDEVNNERVKVRGCTDVLWLIVFILFWFLMILIAGFAFVYGNPLRLVNGYDTFGNTCGSSTNEKMAGLVLSGMNTSDKRYLFFLDVRNVRNSLQICVKKCPDRNMESMRDIREFYSRTGSKLCRYDFDLFEGGKADTAHGLDENLTISSSLGPCPPFPVYKSVAILNRCVPVPVKEIASQVVASVYDVLNSWDLSEQILSDLYAAWQYILSLSLVALVLSLIMVSLFYLIANFVACVIMILVSIAAIGGTGFLWWTYYGMRSELDATPQVQMLIQSVQNEEAFLVYAIIATILTVIILLLVCAMWKRVEFLATLFKESADCLNSLPCLYLMPLFTFIQLIIFYAFWISVVVCLATANYPGAKPLRPFSSNILLDNSTHMFANAYNAEDPVPINNISVGEIKAFTQVEFNEGTWVRYMWWVYLIGLIWTSEFILACQQMIIAGAVARWYFEGGKKGAKSPVWTSVRHLFLYHLGSMALGSMLITMFKVPRLILTYMHAKLKRSEENSEVARCLLKCCICCIYLLEKFIRFMNHNAYTVIAMRGSNFCPAASRAWSVLVSNALRLATVNSVGDFILWLGKALVTALTGTIALLLFKNDPELKFYAAPTLLVCVFAFFIAHCVISLYEIVIDTLFLCICEDQSVNGEAGYWRQNALVTMTHPGIDQPPEARPING